MSGSIYIWKEIKVSYNIIFFELKSSKLAKTIFIVLNTDTYHVLLFTVHKNILSFTKFSEKRKYHRELISYEQYRLTRIISKDD